VTPEQATDIAREAVWVMLKVGAPGMLAALVVGVAISLVQALTQVQEATLSFVPKLVAIVATFVLTAPFVLVTLRDFTRDLFGQIARMGAAGAGGPG
jgi:flagellar biosynthesis protein FliQ